MTISSTPAKGKSSDIPMSLPDPWGPTPAELLAEAGLTHECREAPYGQACPRDNKCDRCLALDKWLSLRCAELDQYADGVRRLVRIIEVYPDEVLDALWARLIRRLRAERGGRA